MKMKIIKDIDSLKKLVDYTEKELKSLRKSTLITIYEHAFVGNFTGLRYINRKELQAMIIKEQQLRKQKTNQ